MVSGRAQLLFFTKEGLKWHFSKVSKRSRCSMMGLLVVLRRFWRRIGRQIGAAKPRTVPSPKRSCKASVAARRLRRFSRRDERCALGRARAVVVCEGGSVEERLLHRGAVLFGKWVTATPSRRTFMPGGPQLPVPGGAPRGERDVVVGGDGQRALGRAQVVRLS